MDITISLPDTITRYLVSTPKELAREMKLSYALRLYRADKITEHEFGEMLGLETRMEIDEVLKANSCFIDYTEDEAAAQRQAVHEVAGK